MLTFMKLCCLVIMEAFAAVIFLEGILQWKQKEPVRFWSGRAGSGGKRCEKCGNL